MKRGLLVAITLLACATSQRSFGSGCDLQASFKQPDDGGAKNVEVWAGGTHAALFYGGGLHVNTDGTTRSYSVGDFWGENTAVNNLCNAMSDACAGLSSNQLRDRRILTQKAKAEGWPKQLTVQTKISPSIIPFKANKPCPEVGGYLVSATALINPTVHDVCDPKSYADAMHVSAIVLPGRIHGKPTEFEKSGAGIGDLVAMLSADGARVVYAVVGDTGPSKQLGEGTIALAGALLGKTAEPANYREVRGKKPYQGKGWDVPAAYTLIFPGSRDSGDPYMTQDRINQAGAEALQKWGGVETLKACRDKYDSHH